MNLQVLTLDQVPEAWWSVLREHGRVFHQKEYLAFEQDSGNPVWCVGAVNGELRAFLPLVVRKVMFFQYAFVPVEAWLRDPNETASFYRAFLETMKGKLMWLDANSTMARLMSVEGLDVRSARFGSYVLPLTLSEEELWARVHSKHRNSVRSAEKTNVTAERATGPDKAYAVLAGTHRRAGLAFLSPALFREFWRRLVENDLCRVYWCRRGEEIQGAAVIPFTRSRAYYYYGGSVEKPVPGAVNLLHWHIIKDLKAAGVAAYDFGGARYKPDETSKAYSIQRFKERFGGDFEECFIWDKIYSPPMHALAEMLKRFRALASGRAFRPTMLAQEIKRQAALGH